MLESKFWHIESIAKYAKGAKMVGSNKICDQYHHNFNFSHFSVLSTGKNRFSKNTGCRNWVVFF